jgi:hypothetical protein
MARKLDGPVHWLATSYLLDVVFGNTNSGLGASFAEYIKWTVDGPWVKVNEGGTPQSSAVGTGQANE